ncbi:MAG TPA: acetyl-CoA C-acetyltransferase [Bacilli bacterium]|jgi:acetyl-CoA C-acetyltransferase|nr:acetyl-CoA C-acetyltransferase [Bacilli bacterium]
MKKVYIVAAKRTAVGSFLGTLKGVHAAELGAPLVKNILESTKVDPSKIDEVIVGNILPAGLGQNVSRQVSIKGGVPVEVPAYSINMACGSAMKAIMNGTIAIKAGYANLILAGGVESMSRAPMLLPETVRGGMKMGEIKVKDHMIYDALTDVFNNVHMGITAENIAVKHAITREEQDDFAFKSQQKAIVAVDAGRFDDEVVPLEIKVGKEVLIFSRDEYPNRTTNLEKLSKLRPAFKPEGGVVTAGNASGINDGGSMVLLASEEAVEQYQLKPLAEIVGFGQGGVEPLYMGLGPVPAIQSALKQANMKLSQMDLIELNEAFAAQSIGVVNELAASCDLTKEEILTRTNVNGGAIALGHAVGSSGGRITVTLIHEMIKRQATYGLASLCIGGGMGTALILKRI